ncbi:hypothetical protein ES703_107542 [subsurface metagenome]
MPIPEAFITLEVFNRDGKLLRRHKQRSHSWTRNAYNLLLMFMGKKCATTSTFGAGHLNYKDTAEAVQYHPSNAIWMGRSGSTYNYNTELVDHGFRGDSASTSNGIVVGSGDNAESFEDYALQTLIAEGSGAGQLNYILSEVPVASYEAGPKTWSITMVRYMNNNSGGNINVNEAALVAEENYQKMACYTRDKLPATVTVPDTGQLKVTYTIQLTYPA